MTAKIKVGVVGCGSIAFGKHLPELSKLEQVELCAFSDTVPERARQALEKFGAPGAKGRCSWTTGK